MTTQPPPTPYAAPQAPINPYAPPGAQGANAPALWNPDAAGLWSLLLTPVFGSVLILLNWQAMNEHSKTGSAIAWVIISIIMLVPTGLVTGFGLLWIIVWYFACQRSQSQFVKQRWGQGFPKKGWLVPIAIAIGSLLALGFLIGFGGMMVASSS